MHTIFKKTDHLIKRLDKFVSQVFKDLEKRSFSMDQYNKTLDSLFKDIWGIEQKFYKYWSTFKYENDYWCELSLMRATTELESAKKILAEKITLTNFKKFGEHVQAAHFFIDYKLTENLGCWRDSVGRCAFDFTAKGPHGSLYQNLNKYNWKGGYQGGRAKRIMLSAPKSYAQNRIPQVLRHISRLIYYVLKDERIDPVEIEAMYWKNKNILFISANDPRPFQLLEKMPINTTLANILLSTIKNHKKFSTHDLKKVITTRNKMENLLKTNSIRMSKWPETSRNIARKIIELLKTFQPITLTVPNSNISTKNFFANNSVYILRSSKNKIKDTFIHAELWFIYILQNKLQALANEEIWVYGKKRPCFTCYFQLLHIAEVCQHQQNGITLHFNPHPGKIWYAQGKFFTDTCLQYAENFLPYAVNYVSAQHGIQRPNYDTDSDSDDEFE